MRVSVAVMAVLEGVMAILSVLGLYFFLFGAPPAESPVVGFVTVEEEVKSPAALGIRVGSIVPIRVVFRLANLTKQPEELLNFAINGNTVDANLAHRRVSGW